MKTIELKRKKEKEIVSLMIKLYCKKNHKTKNICDECQKLIDYANKRIDKCPFMESKTFCSNCKIHCYKPDVREKIIVVMRWSGPRMIFYHPFIAINHVVETIKEGRRQNDSNQ